MWGRRKTDADEVLKALRKVEALEEPGKQIGRPIDWPAFVSIGAIGFLWVMRYAAVSLDAGIGTRPAFGRPFRLHVRGFSRSLWRG